MVEFFSKTVSEISQKFANKGQAFDVKNDIVSQKLQKCYLYSSYETS